MQQHHKTLFRSEGEAQNSIKMPLSFFFSQESSRLNAGF